MTGFPMTPAAQAWGLTQGQYDILCLYAQGYSNPGVGEIMGMNEATVRRHSSLICGMLGANNRVHAMYIAVTKGIIR